MESYTDLSTLQQPDEEYLGFFLGSNLSSPYPVYQASSRCEFLHLPSTGQSIRLQNGIYNLSMTDYPLLEEPSLKFDRNHSLLDGAETHNWNSQGLDYQYYHNPFSNPDMSIENTSAQEEVPQSTEIGGTIAKIHSRPVSSSENRHQLQDNSEKYSKPYTCRAQDCKHPKFGDQGGLSRHTREVHGSETHCCPFPTCKRHTRGFSRKYNLFEHQKRVHSGMATNGVGHASTADAQQENQDIEDISPKSIIGGGGLQEKLERLRALRLEIDSDIEALKRTMDIMGEF